MNNSFDVIIIGAGPSGIFCAYELLAKKPDINILMLEKGRSIEKRMCPKRTTKKCVGCKPCSITTGFAGAGAFSDGKLSLSPDVGGHLPEILGYEKTMELLKEADNVYLDFGGGLVAQRTLEVTKVFDGVDPYQVEMTNPFLAIETSQNGDILDNQEIECEVTVTKTGEPIDINNYTVEGQNAPHSLYHEVHENKIKFLALNFLQSLRPIYCRTYFHLITF